jgi:hypothetical protein
MKRLLLKRSIIPRTNIALSLRTAEARRPRPPADFLAAETDSDRLASRPQFNKFLGHCLVSRVARVI